MARVLALATVALLFLALAPARGAFVGCFDSAGCPDLVVSRASMAPVLTREQFGADDCAVQEGMVEPGTRTLVRFNFETPNVGPGDLVVGAVADHPEWFVWSPCHAHFHFVEYADYRLWTTEAWEAWDAHRAANPSQTAREAIAATGLAFAAGNKAGFCVIDVAPHPEAGAVGLPKYLDCELNQGISVGWADVYGFGLDGQWVDATGLPHGVYVLEAEVNAERLYVETDYANNRAWVPVVI